MGKEETSLANLVTHQAQWYCRVISFFYNYRAIVRMYAQTDGHHQEN